MVRSEESRVPGLSVHAWKQFAAGWAMPTSDCGGGVGGQCSRLTVGEVCGG